MKKRAKADSTPTGADEGWAVLTTLIGGFVVWGGVGWALDRWWGVHFLTPVGLIIGMALGIYAVVARHGGFRPGPAAAEQPHRFDSVTDPRPGPPPASTRRETE